MDRDFVVAPATLRVDDLSLRSQDGHAARYVVIADDDRIIGAIRVNRPLARVSEEAQPAILRDLASEKLFASCVSAMSSST